MALFCLIYRGHTLVKACDYNIIRNNQEQLPLSKCFFILETVCAVCCRDTTNHLKPLRNSSILTQPSWAKPRSQASSAKTAIFDFMIWKGCRNCFFTSVATLSLSSQSKSSPKSWHAAQDSSVEEWCVTMILCNKKSWVGRTWFAWPHPAERQWFAQACGGSVQCCGDWTFMGLHSELSEVTTAQAFHVSTALSCASKFDSSITGFMISVHRSILLNLAHHASDFKQALCKEQLSIKAARKMAKETET